MDELHFEKSNKETCYLFITNVKNLEKELESHLKQLKVKEMLPKEHGYYLTFEDVGDATLAKNKLEIPNELFNFRKFFVRFSKLKIQVKEPNNESLEFSQKISIPGLKLLHEYITDEEENFLTNEIDKRPWLDNIKRRVQHYGYEFNYIEKKVEKLSEINSIPDFCKILPFHHEFDQLTVNEYLTGEGIKPHVDSHDSFDSKIYIVSLGSDVIMNFKNKELQTNLLLPKRSLLILENESRYQWKHGIMRRKIDILDGIVNQRSRRLSLTFRKVRHSPCECLFLEECDSVRPQAIFRPKSWFPFKFSSKLINYLIKKLKY
jgi:hypothetical protein